VFKNSILEKSLKFQSANSGFPEMSQVREIIARQVIFGEWGGYLLLMVYTKIYFSKGIEMKTEL
jgi:hypothetical protein